MFIIQKEKLNIVWNTIGKWQKKVRKMILQERIEELEKENAELKRINEKWRETMIDKLIIFFSIFTASFALITIELGFTGAIEAVIVYMFCAGLFLVGTYMFYISKEMIKFTKEEKKWKTK